MKVFQMYLCKATCPKYLYFSHYVSLFIIKGGTLGILYSIEFIEGVVTEGENPFRARYVRISFVAKGPPQARSNVQGKRIVSLQGNRY